MTSTVYMQVSKDNLELPLAVADSVDELAEMTGTHRTTIFRGIKKKGSGYVKTEVKINEDIKSICDEIVSKGTHHFELAKTELEFHGETKEFQKLIGISEGLRMALSIIYENERTVKGFEAVEKIS